MDTWRNIFKVITHAFTLTLCFASSIARAFVKDVIPPYTIEKDTALTFHRIEQLSLLYH